MWEIFLCVYLQRFWLFKPFQHFCVRCINSCAVIVWVNALNVWFQEFIVTVEEKRGLLSTAELWGKKTAENSSPDGCAQIRKDLEALQKEWDILLTTLSDRKAVLESQMLKLGDLDKSIDQVQRWIQDMKRHLADVEPKSDLTEKKSKLQKTKVPCEFCVLQDKYQLDPIS